jgi:hypothetical protein
MAIKYDEVSHVAFSNASKSAAIEDCVVVRIDMLVATWCQLGTHNRIYLWYAEVHEKHNDGIYFGELKMRHICLPWRKMSKPIDANMKAPRVVDIAGTGSSSFGYIALTEVDRCSNGARSAPAFSIVMTEED